MRRVGLALVLACCSTPDTVTCDDGSVCPRNTTCRTIDTTNGPLRYCADDASLVACEGLAPGAACTHPSYMGSCRDGVCVAPACPNGFTDFNEVCDDDNAVSGDGCAADCSSDERCGNSIVDVTVGEQCDAGDNPRSHDGCSSDCANEQPTWTELDGDVPYARAAAAAYDARRRRVVLFGTPIWGPFATLEWDGSRWAAAATAVASPPARVGGAFAFDAERGESVLFSGDNLNADTWIWEGRRWHQRHPATSPPARIGGALVYDSARRRTLLFGGFVPGGQQTVRLDDLWSWDGVTWTALDPPTRPAPRNGFGMAYDPSRDVVVVFGGFAPASTNELWEFDGTTWIDRTSVAGNPGALINPGLAYDPLGRRVLVIGGRHPTLGARDEVYAWDGATWTSLPSLQIVNGVDAPAVATDPVRGRVIVRATGGTLVEWDGTAWTRPPRGSGDKPAHLAAPVALTVRENVALVRDPVRDDLVMFGGLTDAGPTDETWVWRGAWTRATPPTAPGPRHGAAIAYDEARDEVVLYGGCDAGNDGIADTWTWDGTTWTLRAPSVNPGPRCHAFMTYDARQQQIVLFGGVAASGLQSAETGTWIWNGADWTRAVTAVEPPARVSAAMAFDRRAERAVLFGGRDPSVNLTFRRYFGDTWTWDGTSWTKHDVTDTPQASERMTMAWDSARGRLVLYGGKGEAGYFGDAWEWDGATWQLIATGGPRRAGMAMASWPDGGVAIFGGVEFAMNTLERTNTTWRLRWDGPARYETCTDTDVDGDGLAGCVDPDCAWLCAPLCPSSTCSSAGPRCGDGVHDDRLETCYLCPSDPMGCPARCGDETCQVDETAATCPGDCSP